MACRTSDQHAVLGARHWNAIGYRYRCGSSVSRGECGRSFQIRSGLKAILKAELPGSVMLIPVYDRSVSIVNSITDVQWTLYIAFALVVIVIFLFLGRAKDTLIPAVALPIVDPHHVLVMWALGYSLDNLSLLALTLAIGFLVDDAIVFLENTVRRMEQGETALQATFSSAREISFTILARPSRWRRCSCRWC